MHDVLDLRDILADELAQRRESGFDVEDLSDVVAEAVADGSTAQREELLAEVEGRPLRSDWAYHEPSGWEAILAALPPPPDLPPLELSEDGLRERLSGAWLGRCAGCNLGKPVEGWSREKIRRYLDVAGAFPIDDYFPQLDPFPEGLELNWCWPETTRGNIRFMARDDDTDYTILGLHILEDHGFGFGPEQVGEEWKDHLPFTQTYTAERAAYRNLIHGHRPPQTATFRNPYREWIGAQIRGDMWGYVSPGDPAAAARLAFQDASLSHTQNGIYGEMWASALIACTFVYPDLRGAIEASLAFVPERSRLAEANPERARNACGGPVVGGDAGRHRGSPRPLQLRAYDQQHGDRHRRAVMGRWGLHSVDRPGGRGWVGHGLHRRDDRVDLRRGLRGRGPAAAMGRSPRRPDPERDRLVR